MDMPEITPEFLLRAYAAGIFPMAEDSAADTLYWIDPRRRGVLPLDGMHVPRRLRRTLRSGRFQVGFDHAFERVMEECARATPQRPQSWINDTILTLYGALHRSGHAHSVEVWQGDILAGGLYGVSLGRAFFGESMFSRARDASKAALVHLVARLNNAGYQLLDTQFVTEHLAQFGVVEISRADYRRRLDRALDGIARFHDNPVPDEVIAFLHRTAANHPAPSRTDSAHPP